MRRKMIRKFLFISCVVFVCLFFLYITSYGSSPEVEILINDLKSNNVESWCGAEIVIHSLSDVEKTEELKKALLAVGDKIAEGKIQFYGESAECSCAVSRAIGLLHDEKAVPILLKIGCGSPEMEAIAYFGDQVVDYLLNYYKTKPMSPAIGVLIAMVKPGILQKKPVSKGNVEKIRKVFLKELESELWNKRRAAIAGLGYIANPSDVSLIEKISKEDPYCFNKESFGNVTICPVRKDAIKILEEMKNKTESERKKL